MRIKDTFNIPRWMSTRKIPIWPEDTEYMISRALELKDTREISENAD